MKKTSFYLLEIVWTLMLALACFVPLFFIFLSLPLIIITAYIHLKFTRINTIILALALAVACVVSGGDFVTIVFSILTLSGVIGTVLGLKRQNYQLGAVLAGGIVLAAVLSTSILSCIITQKKPAIFMHDYVVTAYEKNEGIFATSWQATAVARIHYLFYEPQEGDKLSSKDEGYGEACDEALIVAAWDFGEYKFFYTGMALGSIISTVSYLALLCLSRSSLDKPIPKFCDMRLDRNFFLYVFFPVFIFSLLGYIDALSQIAAAVFFSLAAAPAALSAFALLVHTIKRVPSVYIRNTLFVFMWTGALAAAVSPQVLIGVSFLGVADSALNLRRLIDFAFDEGEFKK